jgi:hypothetical protein
MKTVMVKLNILFYNFVVHQPKQIKAGIVSNLRVEGVGGIRAFSFYNGASTLRVHGC